MFPRPTPYLVSNHREHDNIDRFLATPFLIIVLLILSAISYGSFLNFSKIQGLISYKGVSCEWAGTFFFFFFYLTCSRWTSSLPSCLWSQRIFPSLPGSRLTTFLSRCKFSTLTTRQPMVEFYLLLTFPPFPLRKKEHKSYFGKNRTNDFRTSRCADYLLDHSGDEGCLKLHYFLVEECFFLDVSFFPEVSSEYSG